MFRLSSQKRFRFKLSAGKFTFFEFGDSSRGRAEVTAILRSDSLSTFTSVSESSEDSSCIQEGSLLKLQPKSGILD